MAFKYACFLEYRSSSVLSVYVVTFKLDIAKTLDLNSELYSYLIKNEAGKG